MCILKHFYGQAVKAPSSYATSIKHKPRAGAVGPAARRSHAVITSKTHSGSRRPAPTSTRVPTIVLTMECRNALPVMVKAMCSSPSAPSLSKETSITLRHVGLPMAEDILQKLLKSCSPTKYEAPHSIASTSKGSRCHQVTLRVSSGGASPVAMR